jgi:hypothetical protein
MTPSNQPQNEIHHAKAITTENPLAEINASQQKIVELSAEQLGQITGGVDWKRIGLDVATFGMYEAVRPAIKGKGLP